MRDAIATQDQVDRLDDEIARLIAELERANGLIVKQKDEIRRLNTEVERLSPLISPPDIHAERERADVQKRRSVRALRSNQHLRARLKELDDHRWLSEFGEDDE